MVPDPHGAASRRSRHHSLWNSYDYDQLSPALPSCPRRWVVTMIPLNLLLERVNSNRHISHGKDCQGYGFSSISGVDYPLIILRRFIFGSYTRWERSHHLKSPQISELIWKTCIVLKNHVQTMCPGNERRSINTIYCGGLIDL